MALGASHLKSVTPRKYFSSLEVPFRGMAMFGCEVSYAYCRSQAGPRDDWWAGTAPSYRGWWGGTPSASSLGPSATSPLPDLSTASTHAHASGLSSTNGEIARHGSAIADIFLHFARFNELCEAGGLLHCAVSVFQQFVN